MSAKILLIDDERDILAALQDLLELENYKVFCAHNGKDGIKIYKESKPNIIITDMMMPILNGLQVIKIIRNDFKDLSTPIILMSAASSIRYEENSGWDRFIKKPCDIDLVLETVKELLDRNNK